MEKSKVYTRTGDTGKTSLVGGTRVSKSHIRLDAYGTIDELNSFLGALICNVVDEDVKQQLSIIQHKLFTVGSYLATEADQQPKDASIVHAQDIVWIENQIDLMDSKLPKINRFVLPGGSKSASWAHICRSVSRRAERCIYKMTEEYHVDENILKFVNRLSDYFFLLARTECNKNGEEIFWDSTCLY